jgi:hypothetical protein
MTGRATRKRTSIQDPSIVNAEDAASVVKTKRARTSKASKAAASEADVKSSAAHDLFDSSELMDRIYSYLDKPDLVKCLMLNKANTATSARYLYHTIPAEIVTRMSRTSASLSLYGSYLTDL